VLFKPSDQTQLELTRLHHRANLLEERRAQRLKDEKNEGCVRLRKVYLWYGTAVMVAVVVLLSFGLLTPRNTRPPEVNEGQLTAETKSRQEQFYQMQGKREFKRRPPSRPQDLSKIKVKPKDKPEAPQIPFGPMTRPGHRRFKPRPPEVEVKEVDYEGNDESTTLPFPPQFGPMARPRN